MLKTPLFKLATRIACLAVLVSAALWLNASVRADGFTCVLAKNDRGDMVKLTCGTSAGDLLWNCPAGQGYCDSDPANDWLATMACNDYATQGCPEPALILD